MEGLNWDLNPAPRPLSHKNKSDKGLLKSLWQGWDSGRLVS